MIPESPLDFVCGGLHVLLSMDNVHVCVGVRVRLLSLSPSARPLSQHTLQRAPSCHSRRHTVLKNVTIRGSGGGGKEKEIHKKKVVSGMGLKPNKPPHYLSGVSLSLLL